MKTPTTNESKHTSEQRDSARGCRPKRDSGSASVREAALREGRAVATVPGARLLVLALLVCIAGCELRSARAEPAGALGQVTVFEASDGSLALEPLVRRGE